MTEPDDSGPAFVGCFGVYSDDAFVIDLEFTDDDTDAPSDLSAMTAWKSQARPSDIISSKYVTYDIDASAANQGVITMTLPQSVVATLWARYWDWDLQCTDAAGDITLVCGSLSVQRGITR